MLVIYQCRFIILETKVAIPARLLHTGLIRRVALLGLTLFLMQANIYAAERSLAPWGEQNNYPSYVCLSIIHTHQATFKHILSNMFTS
jgi:hypothetical protein